MIWKPIPSCPNYEASEAGDIRRIGSAKNLALQLQKNGYLKVPLWHCGTRTGRWVHQLVCEAFSGPRPPERVAAHDNGVSADNRSENLLWKTNAENYEDMIRHGTRRSGEQCNTWLTKPVVVEIRRRVAEAPRSTGDKRLKKGELTKIAAHFGMSKEGIWQIAKRRSWKHV